MRKIPEEMKIVCHQCNGKGIVCVLVSRHEHGWQTCGKCDGVGIRHAADELTEAFEGSGLGEKKGT
jgi:DnaJ-class molecular chaperone